MDLYDHIVLGTKLHVIDGLSLTETIFGWIVAGVVDKPSHTATILGAHSYVQEQLPDVRKSPCARSLTEEEQQADTDITNITTLEGHDRLRSSVPFAANSTQLCHSHENAVLGAESRKKPLEIDITKRQLQVVPLDCVADRTHIKLIPLFWNREPPQLSPHPFISPTHIDSYIKWRLKRFRLYSLL